MNNTYYLKTNNRNYNSGQKPNFVRGNGEITFAQMGENARSLSSNSYHLKTDGDSIIDWSNDFPVVSLFASPRLLVLYKPKRILYNETTLIRALQIYSVPNIIERLFIKVQNLRSNNFWHIFIKEIKDIM